MTYALITLAGLMAVIVGWLVRQTLDVKPWVEQRPAQAADGAAAESEGALSFPHVKVGLIVFLAVATSLFALLISAYHMRMAGEDWNRLPLPGVLWLNTGVLALASVAMQRTRDAARRGAHDRVVRGLTATGVLSFGFLAGQLLAWQQMDAAGYFLAANPSYAFFYLLTAVHGVHLVGGLWVWARTTGRALGSTDVATVRQSVELCTMYWHYLLGVWVVLFAVLLHTHD